MERLGRAHILVGVAAAVVLSGCTSTPEPTLSPFSAPPTVTASSPQTSAATSVPTASSTATTDDTTTIGDLPSSFTGDQRAAGLVWGEYWKAAMAAYRNPRQPHPELGKYITGEALALLNGYVNKLQTTGRHLVGPTTFWVDSITVSGNTAKGCGRLMDLSHEIDDVTGESKEMVDPSMRIVSAAFTRAGEVWRISISNKGGC